MNADEIIQQFKTQKTFEPVETGSGSLSHAMTDKGENLFHCSVKLGKLLAAGSVFTIPCVRAALDKIEYYEHNVEDKTFKAATEAEKAANPGIPGTPTMPFTMGTIK